MTDITTLIANIREWQDAKTAYDNGQGAESNSYQRISRARWAIEGDLGNTLRAFVALADEVERLQGVEYVRLSPIREEADRYRAALEFVLKDIEDVLAALKTLVPQAAMGVAKDLLEQSETKIIEALGGVDKDVKS